MPKNIPQAVSPPTGQRNGSDKNQGGQQPLSGSKKTKQANHTRHNNGEG
ncbi:small acid-soluble spore protein P [Paenibacillus koleovorans]|nr:small acid-soluble spore protein P [Paenibacillus koleovorans]